MERESEARSNILGGIYSSRVVLGRQRKHIEGTKEYNDNMARLEQLSPGSKPSKLNNNIDAQVLADRYKGTGRVYFHPSSKEYPREDIVTDFIVGETWVKKLQEFVPTTAFTITYSKTGVHIVPVNDRGRK
jgi:hypothetical protein